MSIIISHQIHEAGAPFKKKISSIYEPLGLISSERKKKKRRRGTGKERKRGREGKKCLVNHFVSSGTV